MHCTASLSLSLSLFALFICLASLSQSKLTFASFIHFLFLASCGAVAESAFDRDSRIELNQTKKIYRKDEIEVIAPEDRHCLRAYPHRPHIHIEIPSPQDRL